MCTEVIIQKLQLQKFVKEAYRYENRVKQAIRNNNLKTQ
jgi:hypothetical protein